MLRVRVIGVQGAVSEHIETARIAMENLKVNGEVFGSKKLSN